MSQLDLNNPPQGQQFKASLDKVETKPELYVRLAKDMLLFLLTAGVIGLMVWFCYSTVISTTADVEEKKWAQSMLSAVVGGLIGYLVKK